MRKLVALIVMLVGVGALSPSLPARARDRVTADDDDIRGPGPWREHQPRVHSFDDDDAELGIVDDVGASLVIDEESPRMAQLASSAAGLFLKLVNEQLKGRIDPRSVAYVAPAGVVLEDVVLTAPGGKPVARIGYAKVELSLSALFAGEIAISKIEIDKPQLVLEMINGKLNLLEALTPRKPPDPNKKDEPGKGTFRIDDIRMTNGGFRFNDGENVTLVFDNINARASVDVNLATSAVVVDVSTLAVSSGSVRLKPLDIPLRAMKAEHVRFVTDRVEVTGLTGTTLGGMDGKGPSARFNVTGRVGIEGDGNMQIAGNIDVDAGAWPDRLEPLPFLAPAVRGNLTVTGAFAKPTIDLDAALGSASLFGYAIDSGRAVVRITPSLVTLKEGTVVRLGRGTAKVTGDVVLPADTAPLKLDLRARVADLPLGVALAPAELDTPLRGTLGGSLHLTGTAGEKTALVVAGDIYARHGQLFDIHLPAELDGEVRVAISTDKVTLRTVNLRDPLGGTRIGVDGDVDLKNERLALTFAASVPSVSALMPTLLPADLKVNAAEATGSISGGFKNVVVDVNAKVASGNAYGTPIETVTAKARVTPKEVRIEGATGLVAGGTLKQSVPLVLTLGKNIGFASGTFLVSKVDIAKITLPDGSALPLTGVLDVEASLKGTTKAPRVLVRAAAGGVTAADEDLGDVTAAFVVTLDALAFERLTVESPMITASSSSLRLELKDMRVSGSVDIDDLELSAIKAAAPAKVRGTARGSIVLNGTIEAPLISGSLGVRDLAASGVDFGQGVVNLGVAADKLGKKGDLEVSVATVLSTMATARAPATSWRVQAAYALQREIMNVEAHVRNVDLALLRPYLGGAVVPLEGVVNGAITAHGSLAKPTAAVRLLVPNLVAVIDDGKASTKVAGADKPATTTTATKVAPRSTDRDDATVRSRVLGPVFVEVHLDEGALTGRVCAFPDPGAVVPAEDESDRPCEEPQRVWATVSGTVMPMEPSAQLQVDAVVSEAHIEELVPALKEIDVGVGGRVRVAASVDVPKDGPVTFGVSARLQALTVRAPGAPAIQLVNPVDIDYVDNRAVIGAEPARFVTARDGFDLVIAAGSSVGSEDIDVAVDGQLALSALKLVSSEIANAAGTANTHIKVSGKFADGIVIEGIVEPESGARITPRALGQPIIFDNARISLKPDADDGSLLRVTFDGVCKRATRENCPLRATIGNGGGGKVQLRGSVLARTSREGQEPWIKRYDVAVSATSVEIKAGDLGRIEASMDVALVGDAPAPVLRGRVDVTDGLFRKDFEVSNFILTQAPARPSAPLSETLAPLGLDGLTFDLVASMQNVRAKARVNAFSIDASLRGDLRISRTLSFPALDGAVEVESGTVDFPRARFEIIEMQLQFPTTAEGTIKPVLHLSARSELAPGAAGNSVEVPVDLTIDGGFDAMQLDLVAVDPNRVWTRSELFAYILFGVIPSDAGGADLVSTSVDVASRAALRELAAPVNREVESLVESGLGLDVNIDVVSGFQVQLGQRLVLEGPGLLSQAPVADTTTTTTTAATTSVTTDAVRVRLLLFDHLPIGRALSAEGRFGVASDLRLSWRLFEE